MNIINATAVSFGVFISLLAGALSRDDAEDRGPRALDNDTPGSAEGIDPLVLAHELSAPVSALNVLTNMLANGDLAPEAYAECASAMKGELRILKSLITDVERLSPAASGPFTVFFKPTPVLDMFRQTALYVKTIRPDANIILDCQPDIVAMADVQRIQQVLRNLVSNAVRYTSPDAPIELRASQAHGRVRIEVIDRGPGIAPRLLPLIFQKRVRGPQRGSTHVPGNGLGLFICREIIRAHESKLEVQSSVQRGTTFSFELRGTDDQASHR